LKLTPSGLLKLVDFGLVKVLAPGEMTITIIQGQGTALYTPLEQYGGDGSHTDVRSDIYSFGATLYHLLTNTPPADARERFINPASLVSPKSINPSVSAQMERAILWAMNLHPDERPTSMTQLKDFFTGKTKFIEKDSAETINIETILGYTEVKALLYASIGITAIGFLVSLLF
jgi:serine/threonine-protein kinase